MRTENVITIPAYKDRIDEMEKHSLRSCLFILNRHDIRLVCPPTLDLTEYKELFDEYNKELIVECFDSSYFTSIDGYNRLLMSKAYYERFTDWNYMLIYQPDAYVFGDELDYWCSLGYDYIGAPWCLFRSQEIDLENSGNGGFSLRKISSAIDALSFQGTLLTYAGLKAMYEERGPYMTPLLLLFGFFGFQNSVKSIIAHDLLNEDKFFAIQKHRRRNAHKIAPTEIAKHFSFEQRPSLLYDLTGNKLPFGCHAWHKYEYKSFWKEHIQYEE